MITCLYCSSQLLGLCGTYNKKYHDEMTAYDGTIKLLSHDFVTSWKVNNACENGNDEDHFEKCVLEVSFEKRMHQWCETLRQGWFNF